MTKTEALRNIRQLCEARGHGRGYQKYLDLQGSDYAPEPLQNFDKWWKGPGTYIIRVWPPFQTNMSPWFKYVIQLG